jgi:hypothetical protein
MQTMSVMRYLYMRFLLSAPLQQVDFAVCERRHLVRGGDLPSEENLSSPRAKKFSLFFSGKSVAFKRRPASNEGRIMIVILRETGCGGRFGVVTRFRAWTNGA